MYRLVVIVKDCIAYIDDSVMGEIRECSVCIVLDETDDQGTYNAVRLLFPDGSTGVTFTKYTKEV